MLVCRKSSFLNFYTQQNRSSKLSISGDDGQPRQPSHAYAAALPRVALTPETPKAEGWSPSPAELPHYNKWFSLLKKDEQGRVGGQTVAQFLMPSGLGAHLRNIWVQAVNGQNVKSLDRDGFFVACRLVALAQHNIAPLRVNLAQNVGLPVFGHAQNRGQRPMNADPRHSAGNQMPLRQPSVGRYPSPQRGDQQAPAPGGSLSELLTTERRQKFLQHFNKLQENGRVTARSAWNFFNQSRLDRGTLSRIWSLSDIDRDSTLVEHEFLIAMTLIVGVTKASLALPAQAPLDLVNKAKTATAPPAALAVQSPTPPPAAVNTVPEPQQEDPLKSVAAQHPTGGRHSAAFKSSLNDNLNDILRTMHPKLAAPTPAAEPAPITSLPAADIGVDSAVAPSAPETEASVVNVNMGTPAGPVSYISASENTDNGSVKQINSMDSIGSIASPPAAARASLGLSVDLNLEMGGNSGMNTMATAETGTSAPIQKTISIADAFNDIDMDAPAPAPVPAPVPAPAPAPAPVPAAPTASVPAPIVNQPTQYTRGAPPPQPAVQPQNNYYNQQVQQQQQQQQQQQLAAMNTALSQVKQQSDQMEYSSAESLKATSAFLTSVQQSANQLSEVVQTLTQRLASDQAQIENMNQQIVAAQQAHAEELQKISELNAQIEATKHTISKLATQLQQTNQQTAAAALKRAELEGNLQALKDSANVQPPPGQMPPDVDLPEDVVFRPFPGQMGSFETEAPAAPAPNAEEEVTTFDNFHPFPNSTLYTSTRNHPSVEESSSTSPNGIQAAAPPIVSDQSGDAAAASMPVDDQFGFGFDAFDEVAPPAVEAPLPPTSAPPPIPDSSPPAEPLPETPNEAELEIELDPEDAFDQPETVDVSGDFEPGPEFSPADGIEPTDDSQPPAPTPEGGDMWEPAGFGEGMEPFPESSDEEQPPPIPERPPEIAAGAPPPLPSAAKPEIDGSGPPGDSGWEADEFGETPAAVEEDPDWSAFPDDDAGGDDWEPF